MNIESITSNKVTSLKTKMKRINCIIIVLLQATAAFSFICNPLVSDEICPGASQVKFNLYTENSNTYTEIFTGALTGITYNTNCPFVFITFGFTDYPTDSWILNMITEIFRKGCFNIIVVDWSAISSVIDYQNPTNYIYPITAFRTCCSGEYAGHLMIDINTNLGISYTDIYFVGHSLGAHFAGCAGQLVYKQTGQRIARVTGLDPAGPMFVGAPDDCRLNPSDAIYVDAIHTDRLEAGFTFPLAHMDFWPNGGAQQPGCPFNTNASIPLACNHFFSVLLFTASINGAGFTYTQCLDYINYEANLCSTNPQSKMGFNAKKSVSGSYYLDTLANPPYAMNGKTTAGSLVG